MKNLFQILFLSCAFLFATNTAIAQKKLSKAYVQYEITEVKSEVPQLDMIKGMMLDYYFNAAFVKMDVSLMGFIRMQSIMNNQSIEKSAVLMDMMGKKIQLTGMNEEEMKENPLMMQMGDMEVSYHKKEKKKIAGYKCHKAIAKLADGMELEMYVTKKIKAPKSKYQNAFNSLEGFPLQASISIGGSEMGNMAITLTAKQVSGDITTDTFTVPDGYEKMTMEEFQKQMEGMNLGF